MSSKYKAGDIVWLAEFNNGAEIIPRQAALILDEADNQGMYIGLVSPIDQQDDGLREFSEDQIEGPTDA